LKETLSQIQTFIWPREVTAVPVQFENSTETAKNLLAIKRNIAELETNISRGQLDSRRSQCAALEDLIERQRNSQNVAEKYRTDGIEVEIEQVGRDVDELQKTLR
jgi:hypothetical protein